MSTSHPTEMIAAARKLEQAGDLAGAIRLLEQALAEAPANLAALAGLARMSGRLHEPGLAFELWTNVLAHDPSHLEALIGQARALEELGRPVEAVAALRAALDASHGEARLWSALGRVANQQGDRVAALAYFEEAVRLGPGSAAALYNRGCARLDGGDLAGAERDFAAARRRADTPMEQAMAELAFAMTQLSRGKLRVGWAAYEARLAPDHPSSPRFDAPGGRWGPAAQLAGIHLLAVGEQGIGDQIMFANCLADVAAALGPAGDLSVAVDPRLVTLVRRSLPAAHVLPLETERLGDRICHRVAAPCRPVDLWAPMASLLQSFRRTLGDFPTKPGFLTPDAARVAHWRAWLGSSAPSVGISWRSRKAVAERRRRYPVLEDWAPVLHTPGARIVSLQYGVEAEELAALATLRGEPLLEPPGLDPFKDMDDLAALCVALDAVVSVPNATAALAGACGAQVLFLDPEAAWPRLGAAGYPWYPRATSFPVRGDDWSRAMAGAAAEVSRLARDTR